MSNDSNKYGLTGAEYERAVEICDNATPAPWTYGYYDCEAELHSEPNCEFYIYWSPEDMKRLRRDDLVFVGESRELLPKALKTIAQLTNEISTLRTQAEAGKLLDQMSRSIEMTLKTMLKMAIERIEQNRADDAKEALQKALKSLE